jgi:DNA-binding MarR family transcriptional regulator
MGAARARADVAFFACLEAVERLHAQQLEKALGDDLSAAEFAALGHLKTWGGAPTPRELALEFRLSKAAMSHTLSRLGGRGLVELSVDTQDRRKKRVRLTPAGEAAWKAGMAALRPKMEAVRNAFESADFEAALPFLERLLGWLSRGS